MALKKITSTDLANKGVSGMPDVPGLSTAEMQAKIEEIVRSVVIPAFNDNASNTYDKTEVAEQIAQKIIEIGAGDMAKIIYDPRGLNKDIFASIPNPNLLRNGDFDNLVNQRGQSRYSFDEGYTIDGWKLRFSGDGALAVGNGYISLYRPTYQAYLHQILEYPANYAHRTVTVSVLVRGSGTISIFNTGSRLATKDFVCSEWTVISLTYTFGVLDPSNTVSIELSSQANYEAFFKWAKLEEGAVATPFVPRGYALELIDCMRFFQWVAKPEKDYAIPVQFMASQAEMDYRCTVPMRATPSVVATRAPHPNAYGRIVFINSGGGVGATKTIASISLGSGSDNERVTLIMPYDAAMDVSGFVQGTYDTISGGSIALSAEL